MTTFNERLKELRNVKKLSQRELAEELSVSKSAISMYESGAREPDHEMTEKIADYFNVDMDYLMGRTDVTMRFVSPHSCQKIDKNNSQEYYDDETVRAVTDRLRKNPEYSVMFKAATNVKPEDIDFVTQFIEKMSD